MKKQLVYIFVGAGLLASPAYADRYNRFQPPGGMDQSTSSPGVYTDGSARTAEQIAQMAAGSVQRTDANQPNGYPKLDANRNITSPLLNNTRVGGSDNGTDVSAALANGVPLKNAINACRQASPNVFYGAVNSSSQMGIASNTEHLRASGNVLPYFNIAAIAATVYGAGGATSDISGPIGISGFQNILKTTGVNGIVEMSYSQFMTPDIASGYWQNVKVSDGSASIDDKRLLAQTGFKPTIAMLNMARDIDVGRVANDDDTFFTKHDVSNFATGMQNIKTNAPSIQQVWPWISGNNKHNFDASDPWWANSIKIMKMAGGVGLDMPAGLSVMNGPDSIAGMVAQIKWANSQGIKTLILLSPYGEDTPPGYGTQVTPQWRYDKDFASHVKTLISWFVAADALPTAYAVVNYSPTQYYNPASGFHNGNCSGCKVITANYMGADNDSVNQTVSYVARWVAENAPTSPYTSMPDMGTSLPSACATTVMGGYKTTKSVISTAQIGLGSLAYQDYDKTKLQYPSIYGAQVRGNFDFLGRNQISFGAGATTNIGMLGWNTAHGGITFQNAPVFIDKYNVNLVDGSSLFLEGGNMSFAKTGTNGIQFQNADDSASSWIIGDGHGGINIGSAINVAPEMVTFKKILSLSTHKGTSEATLFLNASGNLVITSVGNIQHLVETRFSADKTFSDPDTGVRRDAKFGSKGIAVKGGTKTDTLKVTGLKGKGNAYACLDASGNLYRSTTACVSN
ncbi:hypothetical protein CSR02_00785 [Acetobacter pomorum]|uniref:Uncharacterized protein n=1 Tax=Acetobacter pomorum TaxID=65959 RepID=A0A2G4RIG0_9PROT|nr:hypothetical protein [Acetobacter pomorum]PHY95515.1 hypothetical protein CSR02_00785 [Acetobacter pomorum]GBR45989.1 hypothetical protein AA11825_0211 [Acetobacter pomorum DSM 11825]